VRPAFREALTPALSGPVPWARRLAAGVRGYALALLAVSVAGGVAGAQTAAPAPGQGGATPGGVAEWLVQGDRESLARRPAAALAAYEKALAADSLSPAAHWRAARELVDLGEFDTDEARRTGRYARALGHARRAVALHPGDAEGHFHLSRALGRTALAVGPRERVRYATDVRAAALAALAIAPRHAGAQHVLGVWHAEVMRLNGVTRAVARAFMGGAVFATASWGEATRLLEAAVAAEPDRIVHRLDLARIYRDSGQRAAARGAYQEALRLALHDANDDRYRRSAEEELRRLP
jgi:tetratricopeptide (TPR) repeat protein